MLVFFREIADRERVTFLVASHDSLLDDYADRVFRLEDREVKKD